ncbi:MAG: substrate-binding domain-containing protein [Kiritimatiellae bacterium]|nr:substrate-binding domain-containing protein [Kiritimatiellia bacterium]
MERMGKKRTVSSVPISPARHVVVALRMAGIAGQDKLNGVFSYLNEGHRWMLSIYRTRHEFTAKTVREEIAKGADGFLVGIPGVEEALAEIAKTSLPVVLLNVPPGELAVRGRAVATVKSDAREVGRHAADALLSQGVYKSYGYVGYRTDDDWSRERGSAFHDALGKAGFVVRMFDITHYRAGIDNRASLIRWLGSLPKPCGILAACDDRAYEILDACNESGIKVPSEVGLLGVNNDPILCENSLPKLSSVQPDFKEEGRLASELLEGMMGNRTTAKPVTRLVGIKTIVHRESTFPLSHAGKLVQKALAFIDRNAARKIGVPDVIAHLKVSRSLAELRFRELQHESIYEAITRVRLEEVKHRLQTTRDTIEKISSDCGWTNANALKNLFRRTFGQSMRDYRDGRLKHGG